MQGFVESGIETEIPAVDLLIDDGAHFPGPSVGGEGTALVADLIGETQADGPFPFLGDSDARANVVADPLNAQAAAFGSEDVEADFEPVGETVGDLDGFVLGVTSGIEAVDDGFGTVDGEIAMEFDHGVAGIDQVVAVNLNFVVVLGAGGKNGQKLQSTE